MHAFKKLLKALELLNTKLVSNETNLIEDLGQNPESLKTQLYF